MIPVYKAVSPVQQSKPKGSRCSKASQHSEVIRKWSHVEASDVRRKAVCKCVYSIISAVGVPWRKACEKQHQGA